MKLSKMRVKQKKASIQTGLLFSDVQSLNIQYIQLGETRKMQALFCTFDISENQVYSLPAPYMELQILKNQGLQPNSISERVAHEA